MRKLLNDAEHFVVEMLEGILAAHPDQLASPGNDVHVLVRAAAPAQGKVGIVTGGGSGHLPVFTGYVGTGLLDACAIGDVFASPSSEQMADAMRAADRGAGVLRLYGNYGGDVMNFDMAGDLVEFDDIRATDRALADDVASAAPPSAEDAARRRRHGLRLQGRGRGGRGGARPRRRDAGHAAGRGQTAHRRRGAVPMHGAAAGRPTFEMPEGEMEIGHGHPRRSGDRTR